MNRRLNLTDIDSRQDDPSFEMMEEIAKRSRKDWRTYTKVIDASMTDYQRGCAPWATFEDHVWRLGWEGVHADHGAALLRDGWIRVTQKGKWYWVVSCSVPRWMRSQHLLPRCAACVSNDGYRCAHLPLSDLTPAMKLYVLALEGGNFYVGVSERPLRRFEQHASAVGGALWTGACKPQRILSCRVAPPDGFRDAEDGATLDLIRVHGAHRVQGGKYTGVAAQRLSGRALKAEEARESSPVIMTFRQLAGALAAEARSNPSSPSSGHSHGRAGGDRLRRISVPHQPLSCGGAA